MNRTPSASAPLVDVELEHVPCDLCGADDTRERYRKPDARYWVSAHEFPVVECRKCGLVYVNPRPTPAGMAPFYPGAYHETRTSERNRRRYARQLELLELREQNVLDVGCASGDFLAFLLERHPEVRAVGVDPYSPGVRDARIEFHRKPLPEAGLPPSSFQLVTAWAVFEHLHRPTDYFREVERVLEPGGRFVFMVTNSDSLFSRRALREDVPRHTYHFSEASLTRYAERFGFQVKRWHYDDAIFDGRGKGTFRWIFARAAGVGWEDLRKGMRPWQRAVRGAGRLVDQLVFATHWEARLGRSGTLVAEFVKPS